MIPLNLWRHPFSLFFSEQLVLQEEQWSGGMVVREKGWNGTGNGGEQFWAGGSGGAQFYSTPAPLLEVEIFPAGWESAWYQAEEQLTVAVLGHFGHPSHSQQPVALMSPTLAPDGHSSPESSMRSLCGHSLALLCSTLGKAGVSCDFPCPQPRLLSVMPRVASSPHQTHLIFISAQATALLFGVHSQNLQVPGGSSAASDGDFVSLPSTPAPGQTVPGPPAHTTFYHLSHLVTICNKPGEGEDLGDPGEGVMWGSRIWPVLKVSKKKFLPVKKLVILNRRQMLHIPEQCCPLFTALIVLNELEPWK